ncbi:indole-3-glycerol phosphate synthase TrpC [Solitalea canadensis]|uniref:Indole-3-glycerol phosphate synthase n=1 Tax=Solitalea canadensis (strain ATCC 29591 / DSM 3403 / JCM 21819 / LMG 8368 / NBRC 15130 / NCIMB 12057 / USAM 9D) TaxID=929556 RepID=H8KXB2_SOLCM|nr:indole-3-glycerol phosphate synthase TrpC [Solitalea canadensis]AFD08441.1 Indole-3-glycerol phosphate synthase [Solitalea canadensis DSM 3403]
MTILDKIVARKREEIIENKARVSTDELEQAEFFDRKCYSLREALTQPDKVGIIAEFKRRSPSKGILNATADVVETTQGYVNSGASVLSILTDIDFFNGSNENVIKARRANEVPILRKDFIVDEYQILEAKAIGADVILLIAACLNPEELKRLGAFTHSLGMSVLLEVHDKEELLRSINPHIDAIGVNNRNLATFNVDVQTSFELADLIPNDFVKVSESALSQAQTIIDLKKAGFGGFLIGETFMKTNDPAKACKEFVEEVKNLS